MLRREKEPYIGMWAIPGGKIEVGEHPDAAVLREFREETGLLAKVERFCGVVSELLPGDSGQSHFLLYVFRLKVIGGDQAEGSEGALRWLTLEDLPRKAVPSDEWIILNMLVSQDCPRLVTALATETGVTVERSYR